MRFSTIALLTADIMTEVQTLRKIPVKVFLWVYLVILMRHVWFGYSFLKN